MVRPNSFDFVLSKQSLLQSDDCILIVCTVVAFRMPASLTTSLFLAR
jgi:hypothetical protein